MATPAIYQARAKVAALSRSRTNLDPDLLDARRALAAASLGEHIRRVVDAAPPLTVAQREHLAALLRPTSGGVS